MASRPLLSLLTSRLHQHWFVIYYGISDILYVIHRIVVPLSKYFVLRNGIFNGRRFPKVSMSKLPSSGWLYYASGHGAVSGGPGLLSGSEHGKIWCRQETGVPAPVLQYRSTVQ